MARRRDGSIRFRVVGSEDGMMLGRLISRRLPDTDVETARELVRAGGVYMGNLRIRVPSVRVRAGERITVYPASVGAQPLAPASLVFAYRDPTFVILDKPAGVPVTATRASARGTLSEALMAALESEGATRPYVGVVHRLDQAASGLVLLTTRDVANASVHRQFVDHRIERTYRVRVLGEPPKTLFCDLPIIPGRNFDSTVRVGRRKDARARPASTEFVRVASLPDGESLLDAVLVTGRTHQIRVHAAALGFPIIGDRRYGRRSTDDVEGAGLHGRLHLHARRLVLEHPRSGEPIEVDSELPVWARPLAG